MTIPPGFPHVGKTCKLLRALYGLCQASRAWYSRIDSFFQNFGLLRSKEDPNLYYSHQNGKHTFILFYVDNILITGNDDLYIQKLKNHMMTTFRMTDLGNASYYLGIELQQTPEGTYFHQKGYIEKLLDRFGMTDCSPMAMPMNPRTKLRKDTASEPVDPHLYQSLVGGLLHATISRWDIQFAVNHISRYLTALQLEHLVAAKNILRYLKGTLNYCLFFPFSDTGGLHTFTDADWAGDSDSRRSTSGVLYKFGNSPIAWSSKLQPTIALSSTEAEYKVLSEAARNITYLRRLFNELQIDVQTPTPILCDNLSSIHLVRNPIMHAQTKHFDLQHHYIREKYNDGTIQVTFIPSTEQEADLLTKPLAPQKFLHNRALSDLIELP